MRGELDAAHVLCKRRTAELMSWCQRTLLPNLKQFKRCTAAADLPARLMMQLLPLAPAAARFLLLPLLLLLSV